MLLKISDSWGPYFGLILLGALLGTVALVTALVWTIRNLFRPKSRRKSWAGLAIFLVVVVVLGLLLFIAIA